MRRWGKVQAQAYVAQVRSGIAFVAGTPNLCSDEVYGLTTFKRRRCGHHTIFGWIVGDSLIVVRILHERMDASSHLN